MFNSHLYNYGTISKYHQVPTDGNTPGYKLVHVCSQLTEAYQGCMVSALVGNPTVPTTCTQPMSCHMYMHKK